VISARGETYVHITEMWKFLNFYRNLGMEVVYKVVYAKGDDIDFQRSRGCSNLN
jgi:hypothetical protein